ncbi:MULTISPECIES: efflux RND transporter permease subunit [unclassified Sulfitobacter]|jgi:hydrophobe/amphiphile efflux-1 (HAE1) family protein|uniref:efflux RND transporter permease subunit n=2 Tax=Sulfitobacter TaxID=60136 RepID=UPI0007C3E44D|nr:MULTISPECIES: efflux RND transporter permease subunit [unclassified Sulfitobacter]KZX98518.1 multidrug resistance protein [Sulfitobacter sp. HI0021]KZY01135.1 multidrug resistance protein [Sulfitobacter sp. HI0027]
MSFEKRAHKAGLADIFVARPIFGIVLNLLIIIAGLAAFSSVDIREMPDVDRPVLSVRTDYDGAVPSTVDTEVTQVLEDALSALDGMSYIESTSSMGSSRITIDLSDGTDVNVAANEAREIVSGALRSLPDDIEDPSVSKSDSNADAIIRLALLGDASLDTLTQLAEGAVYERLSLIDGIAEVTLRGDRANEFRVAVNMPSLLSRGLTIFDVSTALAQLRDDTALGSLSSETQTLSLRVGSKDVTVETINQLPINDTTQVADIAFVQLIPEDASVYTRVNGETAIGLDITRQSVGNTLEISRDVGTAVEELQAQLPEGVQLLVTSNDGIFIEGSINEVVKSILLATGIVVVVIFLFLRSPRATLIPAVTIPVALIGTLAAIWLTGFSVNTISLLALVLATGMVVDDAIVVVENIVRKRKSGMGAFAAAASGTNEVFFAVISTTATLAAVFIPISFLPGQAGGVFSEFGFVLAFAVTLSSITALTLAPVLSALLDPGKTLGDAEAATPGALARGFDRMMDFAIRTPLLVLSIAIGFAMIAMGAAMTLPSTVTPEEDRGFFLVQARGASDTTIDYLDTQVALVEDILAPYRESGQIETVQSIIGVGGGTSAFIVVRLPDWAARDFTQQELIAQISGQLSAVPGVQVSARSTNSLNIRGAGGGLSFAVTGTNLAEMTEAADRLTAAMAQDATFLNPQLSNNSVTAQLEVTVDDSAAGDMGLNSSDVSSLVRAMVQGDVAVSVFSDDVEVDVNVVPGGPPIDDPSDIASMSIRLDSGAYVPLSAVASLETVVSDAQIERLGGALSVAMQANLGEGVDLSTAMDRVLTLSEEVLPDGMGITFTGEAATLDDSQGGIYMVFGVALIVVLLVLAAQFESFASAVVIMMTVPFGMAAALLAISMTGGSLNYYSQIGLVMLIGVMAKNGILIVEFANQLREAGEDIDSAIRSALRLRIRPVMMTMVSTVFGGLPLIVTSGAGAEARIAVGWVIVGGLGFATVFTLFLTPIFYRWITVWGATPGGSAHRLKAEVEATASV